jgi:hypothetical protein
VAFITDRTDRNRWLLLIHQLPKEPAYLRVKIGRKLARVGAIALKNSVYVLPRSESTAEDFQWVRREVTDSGGEATVAEAHLLEGVSDEEIEAKFRDAKDADYAELIREARALVVEPQGRRKKPLSEEERTTLRAELERLERRVEEVSATDFFGATGRQVIAGVLNDMRKKLDPPSAEAPAAEPVAQPLGRTWVTRTGVHVDRIASAWLIRRFIDRDATFKFVPAKGYVPLAGELRFDMFEAEFSHEGENCTFETLLSRFHVTEPVGLRALAEIIHDIDLKENKYTRLETVGVAACIAGMCKVHRDDEQRIAVGSALLEGLLAHFSTRKETRS